MATAVATAVASALDLGDWGDLVFQRDQSRFGGHLYFLLFIIITRGPLHDIHALGRGGVREGSSQPCLCPLTVLGPLGGCLPAA